MVSRGYRWIKDLKKIDPLPISFQEFRDLIFPFDYVAGKLIRYDIPAEIEEKCNLYYKNPNAGRLIRKIGFGFAISMFGDWSKWGYKELSKKSKLNKDAAEFAYKKIQNIPKRYIIDAISAGGCGIVFDYPLGRIEKISFRGFTDLETKFYTWQQKNNSPVFPKIYSLEEDQVIMEKLNTETPRVEKYKEWIDKYTEKTSLTVRSLKLEKLKEDLGESHEFTKFIQNILEAMRSIFGKAIIGDLNKTNIGERTKTGEIVFFDPIMDNMLSQKGYDNN